MPDTIELAMPSSTDFLTLRSQMVAHQLRARDITLPSVLKAFQTVPREQFVPRQLRHHTYADRPLPIGRDQTISQPYVVALMTQLLIADRPNFDPSQSPVLEIGTGSGYQTAILCQIFKIVYTVERINTLASRARATLKRLDISNFHLRVGDGSAGWPRWKSVTRRTGFPTIIVTAAAPRVPPALKTQLAPNGRLVIPVGRFWDQRLQVITRQDSRFPVQNHGPVAFVKLISD
jgi:protein-L-isoaspartate(D-aspartate) O-methyltransferase